MFVFGQYVIKASVYCSELDSAMAKLSFSRFPIKCRLYWLSGLGGDQHWSLELTQVTQSFLNSIFIIIFM